MMEQVIAASRCPRCERVVVPPARLCPDHPVAMEPVSVPGVGEVVTFTTLHSPPEGFKAPLHIALIELEGGARLFCHGAETRGIRIGSSVGVESLDNVFYFSHMSFADRAPLFCRRGGARGEEGEGGVDHKARGQGHGEGRVRGRQLGESYLPRRPRARLWRAFVSSISPACSPALSAPCLSATWARK